MTRKVLENYTPTISGSTTKTHTMGMKRSNLITGLSQVTGLFQQDYEQLTE